MQLALNVSEKMFTRDSIHFASDIKSLKLINDTLLLPCVWYNDAPRVSPCDVFFAQGVIRIRVAGANDLEKKDIGIGGGKSDPYCVVKCKLGRHFFCLMFCVRIQGQTTPVSFGLEPGADISPAVSALEIRKCQAKHSFCSCSGRGDL